MGKGLAMVGVVMAGGLAACSSGSTTPAAPPTVTWSPGTAEAANGTAAPIDVTTVCGSNSATYLAELLHTPPTQLKVMDEWADVVPGGKQLLISGTVATVHLGPGDLPIDHPFGDDLSMDVKVDPVFAAFSQKLGAASSDVKNGWFHIEISSGYIPHVPRPSSASATQTWRQLSDFNLTGFQPGFDHPAIGDAVVVGGRYIVDCGHPDYHTELHPISFLAWAHQDGATTMVHVYENGYRDTEYYNPDLAVLGLVNDAARFANPQTKRFPPYLIDEVARLITGSSQQLRVFELVGAGPAAASTSWQACAPAGSSGGNVQVHYDLQTRPGVTVAVSPADANACVTVQTTTAATTTIPDVSLRTCVMPWTYINAIAGQALATSVDTREVIKNNVPSQYWPLVDRDPLTGCADALSGPPVSAQPAGRHQTTDAGQSFGLYGIITITRS
jgi:hypothetical protein